MNQTIIFIVLAPVSLHHLALFDSNGIIWGIMNRGDKKKPQEMDWRTRYEYEARRQAIALETVCEKELLAKIQKGQIDPYFAIWRAIGKKGTIENAAMVLVGYLQRSPGDNQMLNRYHCAAALFNILDMPDPASSNPLRKQVQWDHQGEEARQEALLTLRAIIEERLQRE